MADDLPMQLQRQLSVDNIGLPPLVGGHLNDSTSSLDIQNSTSFEHAAAVPAPSPVPLSPLPPQISLPPLPLPSSMAVQDMFVKITCVECDGHLMFHCQVPGCSSLLRCVVALGSAQVRRGTSACIACVPPSLDLEVCEAWIARLGRSAAEGEADDSR